jgi:hypothetical protein
MHFRVTSISGNEEGPRVRKAIAILESRLHMRSGQAAFGSDLTHLSIVFVSAFDDPAENEEWARKNSILGRSHPQDGGERTRCLAIGVPLQRAAMKYLDGNDLVHHLGTAAGLALVARPAKVPAGLDFTALAQWVRNSLIASAESAA